MDCTAARKVQKADREKLRRDRLNEQFVELGNILDPDRPKNDKATIIADTIQLLKNLTSQVSTLKDEYAMLTQEFHELTQEKNDIREEKASLKSDIENLNNQYPQRLGGVFPWTAMDHSVMMAPPSYPYSVPVPLPVPPGPIPVHPAMQPYPFFASQNPGFIPNPIVPYLAPNTLVEQQSTQYVCSPLHSGSQSHVSGKQDTKNKSSRESKVENSEDSNDVTTADQDFSSGRRKSCKLSVKESSYPERSSSGRSSSSHSVHDSSSCSAVGSVKADQREGTQFLTKCLCSSKLL